MEEKIKELFATILQITPELISDATSPKEVAEWDSLKHIIMVSGFEEEFGIDVDPEEAVEMYKDFQTFKGIIMRKLN
ncbi:MAG: acyl carrier protein [Nitrospirota bacterium]